MGCKSSKPQRSFTKFLTENAAPLPGSGCRKTSRFPNVDPAEPARSATASVAALREPAMRRRRSEDRCSVMKGRYHALCFSEREIDAFIFEGVGLSQFVADIED